jgi:protein-S-isoprenylcysteine O-methyltransferase Ste14
LEQVYFKISYALLWLIYIFIRARFEKNYKQTVKIISIDAKKEKFLLLLSLLGLLLLPAVWIFTPFLDMLNLGIPLVFRISGIIVSALSLIYFWKIHAALGSNWSPVLEIRKGHELVTTGPYKNIRHPMYAQIWIWAAAQILIISNLAAGFSGIILWAVIYFKRVQKEERMMAEIFGSEYNDYMKKTGRILPRIIRTN